MSSWLLKAAVQGAISVLPARHRLNAALQQHVTRSLKLTDATFATKLGQCGHHLARFREANGTDRPPRSALELGTGWYPLVPIGLALAGVEEVVTVDISSLVDAGRVRSALALFAGALQDGRVHGALVQVDPARAEAVLDASRSQATQGVHDMLARVGVKAQVGDARALRLTTGSVDLLVSNNTLEHVPPPQLEQILGELRRLSAPRAVMDHFIDLSDHYAHFDAAINEFNYLRYSDSAWRLFNNRLQYQNRLRAPDYRRLIESAGFTLVAEESERGAPDDLAAVPLAPQFRHYTRDELLILRAWMTAVT